VIRCRSTWGSLPCFQPDALMAGPKASVTAFAPMSAPVAVGEILAGKYRVDRLLGEGGMGVVVAATDLQLERLVAIKFLLAAYSQDPQAAERFVREARAAVKIQSEHVTRVIDVGTLATGAPYMVMEFLQGQDLAALVEQNGPLPVADAVSYVLQACEAIAEAHANGIVHRDLKPANLFLAVQPDGSAKVKVLDFGISKQTVAPGAHPNHALTRTTAMMGSPLYMSPEQMKSSRSVDARTDIWALGVILYELMAARPPFNADSIPELSAKILLENPEPLCQLRPQVPAALAAVVERALAKDREARYATVAEFSLALLEFGTKRSRLNVERITKVMKAAGLSASELGLPLSQAPQVQARTANGPTQANWGITSGPQASGRLPRYLVLAGGVTATLGALLVGGFLLPRFLRESPAFSTARGVVAVSPEPGASVARSGTRSVSAPAMPPASSTQVAAPSGSVPSPEPGIAPVVQARATASTPSAIPARPRFTNPKTTATPAQVPPPPLPTGKPALTPKVTAQPVVPVQAAGAVSEPGRKFGGRK
jgi:serine/threonine protein kinase